jgi:D-tagatose-1,6-bisphosphate aldolase subunit GatZ/KbaZ
MPVHFLRDVVRAQEEGEARGIWSVCSANRFVLAAAMRQAKADGSVVLIESTSNQVNPEGGYTGQRAADFAVFVKDVARAASLPMERVVLGGDHLGPHPYRSEPAEVAMRKAREQVRQCVLAGYTKLHLDASMRLAGDPGGPEDPIDPQLVTERAADLCAAAEEACTQLPGDSPAPVYVIGTDVPPPGGVALLGGLSPSGDVPPPGGEAGEADAPAATRSEEAERTIRLSREALAKRGLEGAWGRVIAVVVQPGVEFTESRVFEYDRARAASLRELIRRSPGLVFEAHSTDYQRPEGLRALVEDRFAILKVGPWLTFAFREAAFGLEAVEREWLLGRRGASLCELRSALEAAMAARPEHWRGHHRGEEHQVRALRAFGYSDRVRYYWPHEGVQSALRRLFANLRASTPPLPLLSQYLPGQYEAVRSGEIPPDPEAIVDHKIREVTRIYARACAMGSDPERG